MFNTRFLLVLYALDQKYPEFIKFLMKLKKFGLIEDILELYKKDKIQNNSKIKNQIKGNNSKLDRWINVLE